MLRRIKGISLRNNVKALNSIKENNEVRPIVDMIVPGKTQTGRPRGRWIASQGTCRNYGSPRRMLRTRHSGDQEFGPMNPSSGNKRRSGSYIDFHTQTSNAPWRSSKCYQNRSHIRVLFSCRFNLDRKRVSRCGLKLANLMS